MTWLDLLILLVLAVGIARGFSTGVVRQVIGIASVVLAFALGVQLMTPAGSLLEQQFGVSESLAPLLGFILVFVLVQVLLRLVAWFIESVLRALRLSLLNRAAGGLFGAFQAALFLSLLFLILFQFDVPSAESRAASGLYDPVAAVMPATWDYAAEQIPVLKSVSEQFGAHVESELIEMMDE